MPCVAVSPLHLREHHYTKAGDIAVGVNGAVVNFILGCGRPTATVYQQVDVECDGTLRGTLDSAGCNGPTMVGLHPR